METLIPLNLPPGFYRNGTTYQGKNRWINGSLVRWLEGALRPIGGWQLARDTNNNEIQVTGKPRGAHAWRKTDSTGWLATGTQTKLYAFSAAVLTDITPAALTAGGGNCTSRNWTGAPVDVADGERTTLGGLGVGGGIYT